MLVFLINQLRKRSLSPLITTILLIIVTFALIGIVLSWGKGFTNNTKTTLDNFQEEYTQNNTAMFKAIKFYPNNKLIINDLMSETDLNIVGYRILSDHNFPGLNTIVMLPTPIIFSQGDSDAISITRPPANKFDIQLLTNDNKYITVSNIQNYALEPVAPTITSPSNGSSFPTDTDILFSQTTTGGDGTYSCEWKVESTIISTSCDDFNYSFSSGGAKTITLKVTDLEGNTKTISSSLTIIPPLSVTITSPVNNFATNSGTLIDFNSNISGGTGNYSCLWKDNGVNISNTCLNFTQSYINSSWNTYHNLINGVYGLSCVSLNNKIYCTGGKLSDGSRTDATQVYNPSTNSWGTAHTMPYQVYVHACAASNDHIYCGGGYGGSPCASFYIYNLSSNSWSTGHSLPSITEYHSCVYYNNKVYCFGGYHSSSAPTSKTVIIYDIANNSWSNGADMLISLRNTSCVVVDSNVYCVGGYDGSNNLNKLQIYDIINNSWSYGATIPLSLSTSCALINRKIYCAGGSNSTGKLNTLLIYDVDTNTWSQSTNLPIAISSHSCAVVNNKFYCAAGNNNSSNANKTLYGFTPGDEGSHNITLDVNDSSGQTIVADVNITVN